MKLLWPKNKKIEYLIGIDEVGRGPLAGPLTVGMVAVHRDAIPELQKFLRTVSLRDSKQLSPIRREEIFTHMKQLVTSGVLAFAVSSTAPLHIDRRGIAVCIRSSIKRLLRTHTGEETHVRLDGSLKAPTEFPFQETIIKGDEKDPLIALASIAAKVTRDRYMCRVAKKYPVYGFGMHKGYGTRVHRTAIQKYGLSALHRQSYCKNFSPDILEP